MYVCCFCFVFQECVEMDDQPSHAQFKEQLNQDLFADSINGYPAVNKNHPLCAFYIK